MGREGAVASLESREELRVSAKAGEQVDVDASHSWYMQSGVEVSPALGLFLIKLLFSTKPGRRTLNGSCILCVELVMSSQRRTVLPPPRPGL